MRVLAFRHVAYAVMMTILIAAAVSLVLQAAEPVKLRAYPQKFRTFYSPGDSAIPAALAKAGLTAAATDGAKWTGSADGLTRYHPKAAPPDRLQHFASRRYLPDDEVLHVLPDPAGGVWAQTKTGVSHL